MDTTQPQPIRVILFDVYETMLDMTDIERRVNYLLDSKRGYVIWFQLLMQYCFVENCTSSFNGFSAIAKATLQMAARIVKTTISGNDIKDTLELLKHLPLKEGVQDGLSLMHAKGFRIAALTNSPEKLVRDRMEWTGLISYFELVLSAENAKKYKPCNEVYEWAAKQLAVPVNEILMVSAHGWDIAGAAGAGMQTAYITHPKELFYPLAPTPDYNAVNLESLANALPAIDKKIGAPV
jgi:2-haloacid dehalogenase